jgi:hypothetical protein
MRESPLALLVDESGHIAKSHTATYADDSILAELDVLEFAQINDC